MAQKSKSSSSSKSRSGGSSRKRSSKSSSSSGRSRNDRPVRDVVIDAARGMQELVGRPVESVTGVEKNGSEWTVTVEVLELERVPNTTDVLGIYEVQVDKNGELTGAHRTRRVVRGEVGED